MLALIQRELQDHLVYIVLAGLIVAVMIAVAILTACWGMAPAGLGIGGAATALLLALFCLLGAAQMYADRANRISALLATLAVTRTRILAARVLTAVVLISAIFVPLLVTVVAILYSIGTPLTLYRGTIAEVSVTLVLTCLAGHCIGLLAGWTANRTIPALSVLFGMLLLMSFVIVKGFGLAAIGLLLLFIVASLLHVWHRFTSVSF